MLIQCVPNAFPMLYFDVILKVYKNSALYKKKCKLTSCWYIWQHFFADEAVDQDEFGQFWSWLLFLHKHLELRTNRPLLQNRYHFRLIIGQFEKVMSASRHWIIGTTILQKYKTEFKIHLKLNTNNFLDDCKILIPLLSSRLASEDEFSGWRREGGVGGGWKKRALC